MRARVLVLCILLPLFCMGGYCWKAKPLPKCEDKFLNEENDYAEEWALLEQAEADLGDYDTDSEAGWIAIANRYWELKRCDSY